MKILFALLIFIGFIPSAFAESVEDYVTKGIDADYRGDYKTAFELFQKACNGGG